MVLVLMFSCTRGEGDATVSGSNNLERNHDYIVMAIPVDPDGLDPQRTASASTFQITSNIYETLVTVDTGGKIVPCLAESFEVSEDGLAITFHLRENAMFSTGKACTSDSVVSSFERLLMPESPRASYYQGISRIEKVDEKTVTFHYDRLDVAALDSFAYSWAAIVDVDSSNLRSNPVGTGAYYLESWTAQQNIVLKRNPYYPGSVGVDKIEFRIMPDISSQIASFINKDIDIMLITGDQLAALEGKTEYNLIQSPGNGIQLMAMNLENPALSDIRVRQAINHAVDKDELIDAVWWGYGLKLGSHYPVVLPGYVDHSDTYEYNPEKARELLEQAGYGQGELKLEMYLPKSYQEYVNAGIVIADSLKKVGIDVNVNIIEWSAWLEDVYAGRNYDLTVVGHTGRLDPYALLQRYSSTAGENYFNYSNAEMDSLLEAYLLETDAEKRIGMVERMQEILAFDVPALYIQDPILLYVTQPDVSGFVTYPIELYDMKRLVIE